MAVAVMVPLLVLHAVGVATADNCSPAVAEQQLNRWLYIPPASLHTLRNAI